MKPLRHILPRFSLLPYLFIGISVVFTAVLLQASNPQTAYAWCSLGLTNSTSQVDTNTQCALDNWDSIPHSASDGTNRRGMSFDAYMKAIDACGGDTAGVDAAETSCANAITNCLQTSVVASLCSNAEKMADVASLDCGHGTTFNCNDINESNQEQINKVQDDIKALARSSCDLTGVDTSSASAINARLDECEKRYSQQIIAQGCASNFVNEQQRYNEIQDGINKAKACMNNALKTTATSKTECDKRGGRWIADQSGTGDNYVEVGCYANYSDLVNQEACQAGGGLWKKINDTGNPNHWECQPPDNKYNDGTDKNGNNSNNAGGVDGNVTKTTDKCGDARVNILACSSTTGAGVLNDLLKIIISVLSVLIGIAAVGGLAWAAVMYAKAEDDSSKVSEAKTMVRNVAIGLLLYGFLIAIVNWLIPGSVIGNGSGGGWFG